MTTGEKIRELRKAQGLTQEELAQKIGIKRGTLAQYETGKRSPKRETLERFAKALNVQWYDVIANGNQFIDGAYRRDLQVTGNITQSSILDSMNMLYKIFGGCGCGLQRFSD